MKKLQLAFAFFAFTLIGLAVKVPDAAAAYEAGRIIDDSLFLDAKSMSAASIQQFFVSKNAGLANKSFSISCYGADSTERKLYTQAGARCDTPIPASEVIYYASQVYGVSPRVILATIQKEQSLATAPNPTDWQLNQAMGFACPTSGQCGTGSNFAYQIDSGTWALRYHFERAKGNNTWWNTRSWTCGTEKNLYKPNLYPRQNVNFIDQNGTQYATVYIQNAATSSFYCYTPHAYNNPQGLYGRSAYGTTGMYYSGSYNFVTYFEQWFGSTKGAKYAWSERSKLFYADDSKSQQISSVGISKNQYFYVEYVIENTGAEIWDNRTILGRTNNEPSVFCTLDWLSCNRPATIKQSRVAPGETATIGFWLRAPGQPGVYKEHYNMLIEGVSWFTDIGSFFQITVRDESRITDKMSATTNNIMKAGDLLYSLDKQDTFLISADGNLEIRTSGKLVWRTGDGKASLLKVQTDGNLVLYDRAGNVLWVKSNPGCSGQELKIMSGAVSYACSNGTTIWDMSWQTETRNNAIAAGVPIYRNQSVSSPNGRYKLIMQDDGNLVIYGPRGAEWSTRTRDGLMVIQQNDGNFVLYNHYGRAVWASNRSGLNVQTYMQDDGNLVSYTPTKPIWARH